MAYHFTAETRGPKAPPLLQDRLARYTLIEFFTVEVSSDALTVGISVPFRSLSEPGLNSELVDLMNYLILDQDFEVTDLFTGRRIGPDEVAGLLDRISS